MDLKKYKNNAEMKERKNTTLQYICWVLFADVGKFSLRSFISALFLWFVLGSILTWNEVLHNFFPSVYEA